MDTRRPQPLVRAAIVCTAAALLFVCLSGAFAEHGAITSARNLSQLIDEAGLIVRGQVISTRVEPHPQYSALWTVVVTLQVAETLKGQVSGGSTYTFRQYIWDPSDRTDAAGYQKGGQMLLLLLKPNANGLSSPVGLEQGRFKLRPDRSGKLLAANGRNNIGLFQSVADRAAAKGIRLSARSAALASGSANGPVALDDLRNLIRELAGTSQP